MNSFLYVCSRPSFEVSKTAGIIGFHDSVATLNRVLAEVQVGDPVYFYITREMRLAARARATREGFLDASPIFATVGKGEIFARRIGIKLEKDDLDLSFRESVVPKLTDLFPPDRKAMVSAYLVSQFIRLSPRDAAAVQVAGLYHAPQRGAGRALLTGPARPAATPVLACPRVLCFGAVTERTRIQGDGCAGPTQVARPAASGEARRTHRKNVGKQRDTLTYGFPRLRASGKTRRLPRPPGRRLAAAGAAPPLSGRGGNHP